MTWFVFFLALNFPGFVAQFNDFQKIVLHYYVTLLYENCEDLDCVILAPEEEIKAVERLQGLDYVFLPVEDDRKDVRELCESNKVQVVDLASDVLPKSSFKANYSNSNTKVSISLFATKSKKRCPPSIRTCSERRNLRPSSCRPQTPPPRICRLQQRKCHHRNHWG